jgi:radical SAM protein with 4Fe4S-binding SPASM domain
MLPYEALAILHSHGLRPPRVLTLAITGACNLACRHCWVEAGGEAPARHVPERTVRRLIEEFRYLDGEGVCLTGGEPLCHPSWLKLLQFCRSVGIDDVALQTNATLFDSETVAALRDLNFRRLSIQVSLDGAGAATHDLVRGEGAFGRTMAGLGLLIRGGLAGCVSIFFTEMRHNLMEIPELLELSNSLGVGAVVTGTLVLHGRAGTSGVEQPGADQYLHLLERFDADQRFRELYEKLGSVAALEWSREHAPRTECCTFVENPYLTPEGKLYPCVLCPADNYAVAGVFGRNLAAAFAGAAPLWSALAQKSSIRVDGLSQCRDCAGIHTCAGGCMGRAMATCGDPCAADDRCALRRLIYERKSGPR